MRLITSGVGSQVWEVLLCPRGDTVNTAPPSGCPRRYGNRQAVSINARYITSSRKFKQQKKLDLHLQIDIFFHFKMCHDRKNDFNSTTKSLGHHNLKVDQSRINPSSIFLTFAVFGFSSSFFCFCFVVFGFLKGTIWNTYLYPCTAQFSIKQQVFWGAGTTGSKYLTLGQAQ